MRWSFVALGVVATSLLLLKESHGFNIQLSMKLGNEQMGAAPIVRGDFVKTAALSLLGAGFGMRVLGEPVESVSAAEPLIDTCEKVG